MYSFKGHKRKQKEEKIICFCSMEEAERGSSHLSRELEKIIYNSPAEPVFLCIGSDRSTGDSFGPLVGTMLKKNHLPYPVVGTLANPVHALNLESELKALYKTYNNPLIIGIDACLGDYHQIGHIYLKEGSFSPGNAVDKLLSDIGDYHITATVNYLDAQFPYHSLNSTRLHTVITLAELTAGAIIKATDADHRE